MSDRLLTAAVGVPLIAPAAESKVRPAGRVLIENVYGAVPPLAVSVFKYGTPTLPLTPGNCSCSFATIVMAPLAFEEVPVESVTVAATCIEPTVFGLPVTAPVVLFTFRP